MHWMQANSTERAQYSLGRALFNFLHMMQLSLRSLGTLNIPPALPSLADLLLFLDYIYRIQIILAA